MCTWGLMCDIAVRAGPYANTLIRIHRAASVKSVQSVRKYHAWNLWENVTYGIRVPLSIAQLYVQYVVLSKTSLCSHIVHSVVLSKSIAGRVSRHSPRKKRYYKNTILRVL